MGDDDREFKWNNYLSRYHMRHLDLMDLLALYQPRANVPLDELAKLMGFPGKFGMDGSAVWGAFQRGDIAAIRNYCETDVVNTYLVFLRFQLMRGIFDCGTIWERMRTGALDLRQSPVNPIGRNSSVNGIAGKSVTNPSKTV